MRQKAQTAISKCINLCKRIAQNELLLAIAVVLILVLVGVAFGRENNKLVPTNPAPTANYTQEPNNPLSLLAHWDSPNYLAIAQHGYTNKAQTNFFPLYPLITNLVRYVARSWLVSALLVSWVSLLGAVYFYLKIIKQLYGTGDNFEALRGVLFFLLFPTGVFLLAAYTESLFAFLALGAIYYALRKRYLPAALFGLFATATHINGLFVLVLVALLLLEQKEKLVKIIGGLLIGSLGLVAYMSFLAAHFHNPLAFITAQKAHGWLSYHHSSLPSQLATLNGLFLLFVVVSVIYWWQRRKSFAIYSLLYACIAFLGELGGFGRYALMAFPIQLMLYDYFRHKKLGYSLVLAFSAVFWMYFLLQYVGGYTGG